MPFQRFLARSLFSSNAVMKPICRWPSSNIFLVKLLMASTLLKPIAGRDSDGWYVGESVDSFENPFSGVGIDSIWTIQTT